MKQRSVFGIYLPNFSLPDVILIHNQENSVSKDMLTFVAQVKPYI